MAPDELAFVTHPAGRERTPLLMRPDLPAPECGPLSLESATAALVHACAHAFERGICARQQHGTAALERFQDTELLLFDALQVLQAFEMRGADLRENAHLGPGDRRETLDLARIVRAHLEHQHL